jgi:hypothetical protein
MDAQRLTDRDDAADGVLAFIPRVLFLPDASDETAFLENTKKRCNIESNERGA